jgi:saccharopine dehydrogenase-like NADP-dependent oxidoreductase
MIVLVLGGAGMMGSGTILDLLSEQSDNTHQIVASDFSEQALARLPDHPRLSKVVGDVRDANQLSELLGRCDLCINGVPTFAGYQMAIFEACLAAGCTYVDYGGMGVFTVKQKARHQDFLSKNATAVIGLGADPGLSNVICRACADRLDEIDSINLYWTATTLGPESSVLVPPYNSATILSEYANPSWQFFDGELREMPPRSGRETWDLPQPFGSTNFMFSQHSEPLTVPFAEGIADKGIKEFTWRLSLPQEQHQAWLNLVKAGFGDYQTPVTLPDGRQVKPLDVLEKVIARHIERHREDMPVQESHELHFAVGKGRKSGLPTTVTVRVIGSPHPMYEDYVDAATSMNMSIGVQQILNAPRRPGVWAPEEYFDVSAYLAEVRRRHFKVSIETVTTE